jgi:ribulose-phosphate 3-epimerase
MLEVHLMIEHPERQLHDFVSAGADSLTIHAEATPHLAYAVNQVRELGAGVGVAINPASPPGLLAELPGAFDIALCMTVNPGWGGQAFIEHSLQKLPRLRALVGDGVAIEVDGGMDTRTAPACARAGARLFVAGSAVFDAPDPAAAFLELDRSLQDFR